MMSTLGWLLPNRRFKGWQTATKPRLRLPQAPGHVFREGGVRVIPAMGEGMVSASGHLSRAYDRPAGRVLVIDEDYRSPAKDLKLPVGHGRNATIFTSEGGDQSGRGLIRVFSWENWIFA